MAFSTEFIFLFWAAIIAAVVLYGMTRRALKGPERFPSAPWGWPEAVFSAVMASFFIFMAIASAERPAAKVDLRVIGLSLAIYAALVSCTLGFLIFRGIDPIEAFGLRWRHWRKGLFFVFGVLLLALPVIYMVQLVTYYFSGPHTAPQAIVNFLLESSDWKERIVICVAAVFAAPITEELIFRGCLYGVMRKYAGRSIAMVGTSALFALIHGHVPSLPGLFLLAIVLSLIYEATGSLWAPISLHAAFNGFTILIALFWPGLAK